MCRTADDLVRLLGVIVGIDPANEATAIHAEWLREPFVDVLDERRMLLIAPSTTFYEPDIHLSSQAIAKSLCEKQR